ncbi:MAG: FG-GAP repeat domain-containing protein, partial [Nostoc sp.]
DFNNDSKLDLAVANNGDNTVSVLLGNGNGLFQTPMNSTVGNNPSFVISGDFNNDNKLDLAVANNGDNTVSVLLGNGNGSFQTPMNYTVDS